MSASAALAVTAAAAAGFLAAAPPRARLPAHPRVRQPDAGTAAGRAGALRRLRPLLALLAGLGAWLFVGGGAGPPLAVAAAVVAWVVLGRTESPAARRRRERLARDLPTAVELVAACLAAGSDVDSALVVVADALGGPVAEEFRAVHHRLAIGAAPTVVWRDLAGHPQLGRLGSAVLRSHQSGASVAASVRRLGVDLAAAARADVEGVARRVGVTAALPLGVCFLPAFLVLGVLPMAVGLFTSMHVFG